jgi:hypothetical protein
MLHCSYYMQRLAGAFLNDIVDSVLSTYGSSVSAATRQRLFQYITLLASAGKTRKQLQRLGVAYLREVIEPNPRYSGC